MKLIDIQRHFFRLRGDKNVYFCTDAETTANLNVIAVNYIRANHDETLPTGRETMPTRRICGSQINDIQVGKGLGMPYNPASEIRKLDTQVPDSMGDDTHQALAKLTDADGVKHNRVILVATRNMQDADGPISEKSSQLIHCGSTFETLKRFY